MKTENELIIEQMSNDVLYSIMKCFIERKAKEYDLDKSKIYLKVDEYNELKVVETYLDIDNVYLELKDSDYTS